MCSRSSRLSLSFHESGITAPSGLSLTAVAARAAAPIALS
jgi:hypothetical protein